MNDYIGQINAGFTITLAIPVGESVFVLAHNERNRVSPWVTWHANSPTDYNQGHYFMYASDAYRDLYRRAAAGAEVVYS